MRSCSKTVQGEDRLGLGVERQMMADDEISSTARAKKLSPLPPGQILISQMFRARCWHIDDQISSTVNSQGRFEN